jgi:hypothetical protein
MWVWKKLGFDQIFELPSSALDTLGRRCRVAESLPKEENGQLQDILLDEQGNALEFCPSAQKSRGYSISSMDMKSAPQPWQLVPVPYFNKGRKDESQGCPRCLCMPGSIELVQQEPEATLINCSTDDPLRSVQHAVDMLVSQGQGSFRWRIPKAYVKLTDMALSECKSTPGPKDWPLSVVGAIIGAELEVTYFPESCDSIIPLEAPVPGDGSTHNELLAKAAQVQEHLIQCESFRVHIVQRGGPLIDPARLHGVNEETLVSELERWSSKTLPKRPSTWRTLCVSTKESSVSHESSTPRSNILEKPCHGRRSGDVVLAATATSELTLEPFELSYGDSHIRQIRRTFEDEVACLLGLRSSQVLCSDLQMKGKGLSRQKHVRRDTVQFRFAILHDELAKAREETAKTPFGGVTPVSPPASAASTSRADRRFQTTALDLDTMGATRSTLPPIGDIAEHLTVLSRRQTDALQAADKCVNDVNKNAVAASLKQTMEATIRKAELEKIEDNLKRARGSKKTKFNLLTQADDSMVSLHSADYSGMDKTKAYRKTMSCPDLAQKNSPKSRPGTSQQTSPASPFTSTQAREAMKAAGIELGQDKQPDHLLKAFLKILGNSKHPWQRRPDVFPVLARIPRGWMCRCGEHQSSKTPSCRKCGTLRPEGNAPALAGRTCESLTLVTHSSIMGLANIADSFKETIANRVRPKKKMHKDADDVDTAKHEALNVLRRHVLEQESRPDTKLEQRREDFRKLSAKSLLDQMDASYNLYNDLTLCLEVQMEKNEDNEDEAVKFRSHGVIKRVSIVIEQFKADRNIIEKCIRIYSNQTKHDPGSIDGLFDHDIAPMILESLKCFPKAPGLQLHGCRVLRRLYDLARHKALQGRRFVLLGKTITEVWTFQGIKHVLETMGLFRFDVDIQLECFNMLVPLADMLATTGMSVEIFKAVEMAMRDHSNHADLLSHGIHAIARIGPTFMAHDHTGIRSVVDAMAQHRSCIKLQRVGNKALFALSSEEDSLKRCRLDGAVSAIVQAMFAHHKDQQVLQMGTRSLERYCPRGLLKLSHVCGDLASVLPIVLWRTDPVDYNPPCFNVAALRTQFDFDNGALLDDFHADVVALVDSTRPPSPPSPDSKAGNNPDDRNNLATLTGFRRAGLRDEIDARDAQWSVPGPPPLHPPVRVTHNVLAKDVKALKKHGCDIEPQLVAGPRRNHLKLMCDAFHDGLPGSAPKTAPKAQAKASESPPTKAIKFGPEDAELFACILGFFSWHSVDNANALVGCGGVGTLVKWLRCKEFTQSHSQLDAKIVYPMQRACLSAMACVARHGEECAQSLLSEGAHTDIIDFVTHDDIGMRRSALRCLARLIPFSRKRGDVQGKPWPETVMPVVLQQLEDNDEALRTAAAACALEGAVEGWCNASAFQDSDIGDTIAEEVVKKIVTALRKAVNSNSAAAALPILLTLVPLAEDDEAVNKLKEIDGLLPLLTTWPPRSAEATATGVDRAAAAAAAKALECLLVECPGVIQMSVRDLQMLLKCASSDHTMPSPTLREALEATLKVAVEREADLSFLAQLFGTQVQAANGRFKLANLECLTVIAQHIKEKVDEAGHGKVTQVIEILSTALDHVEPLFYAEMKGETGAALRDILKELRQTCGGPEYTRNIAAEDGSPSSDQTRLPPINRAGTGSVR